MRGTARLGDKWIAVTSLPVVYMGAPLYELGGAHLALLLPVLEALPPRWLLAGWREYWAASATRRSPSGLSDSPRP